MIQKQKKEKKMAGINLHFKMSINSTLNGFLLKMLRSSVLKITLFLSTKTIIYSFNLAKYSATIHLDFKEKILLLFIIQKQLSLK